MPTALVTGASSGIGLEIAKELARKGYDLVLVARRQDRLEDLAALLAPHVAVQVMPLDLSAPEAAAALFAKVATTPIEVLVNNAGFADYGLFAASDAEKMSDMLAVNVVALTELTRLFLPGMLARGRGRVLNAASTAAFLPGPYMSVYYASKAYVLSLSEAVHSECRGTGVTVTCLCPGPTRSEFQERAAMANSRLMQSVVFMDPRRVARQGVRAMLEGRAVVIPGFANKLLSLLPRALSRGATAAFVNRVQSPRD